MRELDLCEGDSGVGPDTHGGKGGRGVHSSLRPKNTAGGALCCILGMSRLWSLAFDIAIFLRGL